MAEKKNKQILKIGIIQQSPDLGGAEFFMLGLISEFKNQGKEVVLATNAGKYFNEAQKENVQLEKLPGIMDVMGNTRGLIKTIVFSPFYLIFYLDLFCYDNFYINLHNFEELSIFYYNLHDEYIMTHLIFLNESHK